MFKFLGPYLHGASQRGTDAPPPPETTAATPPTTAATAK